MIQEITDRDLELLSQYLDGELPAADSRILEGRLRAEPSMGSALLQLQQLNHRLCDAFAERDAVAEDVVQRVRGEVQQQEPRQSGAQVLPFPGAASAASAIPKSRPVWLFASAASLLLALGVVLVAQVDDGSSSKLPGNDKFVSVALDNKPSGDSWSALQGGREIQVVLSFPHENGGWCREYLLRGGDTDWRAVACRENGQWITKAAGLESYLESTDMYRPAGASDSENVAVFISQHAADIALGIEQEKELISKNWR